MISRFVFSNAIQYAMENLLIAAAILILLLIIILSYRRGIILIITRLIYGKYSYNFLHTFKRYFIRSPFQYCFRDEFVAHVLFILDKRLDLPSFKSEQNIDFENVMFFTPFRELLKIKGEPYCFNAFAFQNPDFIIKSVGYHQNISGNKVIAVFYFMDDLFFMGEYIFKKSRPIVKEAITRRYLNGAMHETDNFYIENTRDRIIHYHDTGFTIDVKFLSRENKEIISRLKNYHDTILVRKLVLEEA